MITSYAKSIHYKNIQDKIVILSDECVVKKGQNSIFVTKVVRAISGNGCYFGADDSELIVRDIKENKYSIDVRVLRSDIIGWLSFQDYQKLQMMEILRS